METESTLIPYLLATAGTVFGLLIVVIAFFVGMFIKESKKDIRQALADIALLKTVQSTAASKTDGDIKLLTREVDLQILAVTNMVRELTKTVQIVFEKAVNKD